MFKAGVGIGEGSDDYSVGVMAVSNAITDLRSDAQEHTPQVGVVFSSPKYNYEDVIRGIRSVLGEEMIVVGASTSGEITNQGPTARESVVLMLLTSDSVFFTGAVSEKLGENGTEAGKELITDLQSQVSEQLKLLVMFPDGLSSNVAPLINAIRENADENLAIVGGSAADGGQFKETAQFFKEQIFHNSVVGLGMTGKLTFSVGVEHGWNPIGAPRTVTEAEGSRVISISDKPAFNFYRDYLGEEEAEKLKSATLGEVALAYPIGMADADCGEWLLRAPLTVEQDGSVVFGGVVPTGATIQLMMGSRQDAVNAAHKAATTAMQSMTGKVAGAFVFSCHIRNSLFSGSHAAENEITTIMEVLGSDIPLVGFYTYAEQAPVGSTTQDVHKCPTEFHNESLVVVLFGEHE